MHPHHQPWKTLYLLGFIIALVVQVPYWSLCAVIFPSSRPNKSWSVKKTVSLYVTRHALSQFAKLRLGFFDSNVDIPDGTYKNTKFVWIESEREEDMRGPIKEYARRARVEPLRTSAFWYYRSGTLTRTIERAESGEQVIYYIHGGAFFHGTAHPKGTYACIPKGILRNTKHLTRILAIDYHLCSSAPHEERYPFPTAIIDLIAGYRYLLDLGFSPENIVVTGDSAGGNLVLALIRYVKETAVLPMPGRLLLLSPWGDISASNNGPNTSLRDNLADIFSQTQTIMQESFAGYGIRSYLGSAFDFENDAKTNPYISPASLHIKPAHGEYQGYPRTLIIVGGMERILDDSMILADRLRQDNPDSDRIAVYIANAAVHDFLLFPWAEPERAEAFLQIAKWLED